MFTDWYRKKPVEIQAFQFTGGTREKFVRSIPSWFFNRMDKEWSVVENESGDVEHIAINTLEGTMMADIGDYIIKGVKGELYPCKPDIFMSTYEAIYR